MGLGFLGLAFVAARPVAGASLPLLRGTVALEGSERGALVSSTRMAPGDAAAGSIVITNSGSLSADVVLSGSIHGSRPLARELWLTIRAGAKTLYSGPLARLGQVGVGRLGPGEARRIAFRVSLGDAGRQGLSTAFDARWTATQA